MSQDPELISAAAGVTFGRIDSDPQQFNAYSYALNRPTVMVDPNGEEVIEVITIIGKRAATRAAAGALIGGAADVGPAAVAAAAVLGTAGLVYGIGEGIYVVLQENRNNADEQQSEEDMSTPDSPDPSEDPEIAKKMKKFKKKSLRDQKREYETMKKTFEKHLKKYGQEAGNTSGEVNRIEREVRAMEAVLRSRGQSL
jgi:hypothetical protein